MGHRNRTGKKYKGHYDLWLSDEIVELGIELGVLPSFRPPPVLATRMATSETFGIVPLSSQIAEKFKITMLPNRPIIGVPHHHDTPVHVLTRLSTRPINRYRYMQLRQRTLYPMTPVHTWAEYNKFKAAHNDAQFKKNSRKVYAPHEAFKTIDWDKFTIWWNAEVDRQDRTEVDSNKRLYYKVPNQLEHHHKKVLTWKSECTTLFMGGNADALKPFRDLLLSTAAVETLPASQLPNLTLPIGLDDGCYSAEGE